jgi:hypothetical protein
MKEGDLNPIRLQYLGAFVVPPKRKELLEKNVEKAKQRKQRRLDAHFEYIRRLEELNLDGREDETDGDKEGAIMPILSQERS